MQTHILIVEDYPDFRQLVGRMLQGEGYAVSTADSAEEAMDLVERDEPALVICDLDLPGKSGLALMRQLRATHPVPAISMSGSSQYEDGRAAEAAGYAAHLVKPFDFDALLGLVHALVAPPEPPLHADAQPSA